MSSMLNMPKDRSSALQAIATVLNKLNDPDPDIRFMQLSDLANILNAPASEYIKSDNHTAARLIDSVIKTLKDQNGEVQNQALKCIGPLGLRIPNEYTMPFLDKITDITMNKDIDVSVPNTALRVLVSSLPQPKTGASERDIREAYHAISKVLIPRLVGYQPLAGGKSIPMLGLLCEQPDKSFSSDAVDVMIEVVGCYGPVLAEAELWALAKAAMEMISSSSASGVVKKRAMVGIGAVTAYFSDEELKTFMGWFSQSLEHHKGLQATNRKFLISTIGTLSRSIPTKIGPYLDMLSPSVLSVLSQEELDAGAGNSDDEGEVDPEVEELREAALVAVESLITSCPREMQLHLDGVLGATLRFLKYDPNVADIDDEDMDDVQSDDGITEDAHDDEDDEYAELDDEAAFSDVDDMSWKVRRCAAKALLSIISNSLLSEFSLTFSKVVPSLISRLSNEREDNVRLEVIACLTAVVKKASAVSAGTKSPAYTNGTSGGPLNSRKRRREDSESVALAADVDLRGLVLSRESPPPIESISPPSGAGADLANIVPKIVQSVVKMWKKASLSLKQSAVVMLRSIALSRNGAVANHLQQLEDPIADALKSSGAGSSGSGSGTSATVASLQIETLSLISTITETNGTTVLIPFVIALIPSVTGIVRDRNFKVSIAALAAVEQFVKALTPPRLQTVNQEYAIHVQKLHDVVLGPIVDINTDAEVRHRAIQVLGVLLARTSGTSLLPQATRTKALGILGDRLKNETSRLESARAISLVAEAASPHDNIGVHWVEEVSIEMADQLRKSDRALRSSCLEALQYLCLNSTTVVLYDTKTIQRIESLLMPLVSSNDLHLLTPALVILSKIIPTNAAVLVTGDLIKSLCLLSRAKLEAAPLRAYLLVLKVVGENGVGQPLMKELLAMGTDGETNVLGRAIGTLIAYGGSSIGISVPDFLKELNTSKDARAQCLALAVLGEVGHRSGSASPVNLDVFVENLESGAQPDKTRLAAALALGSAGASNITQSMPILLRGVTSTHTHLYLHAIKEMLQTENAVRELAPYASELWSKLLAASAAEDVRTVGAECIGRLAQIDAATYVPELARSLEGEHSAARGTVISAFRFTLSDASSYDAGLLQTSNNMLKKMLADPDLGNRREAIMTLNAAIHSKPELVLQDLTQILPLVLADSFIRPELIKTVKIGPFTHQEDAGLDVRKATYGTMYTLLDTPDALPQLPIGPIFDRIVDGIADDHDIRTLCNIMLSRLIIIEPTETRQRLFLFAEKFKAVLSTKLKDNAVKQEIEKANEANAAVIRITMELERAFPASQQVAMSEANQAWKAYLEWVKKEFAALVRGISNEEK